MLLQSLLCVLAADANWKEKKHSLTAAADSGGSTVPSFKYFFHVHKCGGSSMCKLAEAHGERVDLLNNCNGIPMLAFDCNNDRQAVAEQSADDQLSSLRAAKWTFVANECMAPHEMVDSSAVVYAISLREPLERAASNFRYADHWNFSDFGTHDFDEFILQSLNDTSTDSKNGAEPAASPGPVASSTGWVESTYSDFLTRYLSGKLDPGPVTEEDLNAAKAALRRMDVLIDIDHPQESMQLLGETFGWGEDVGLPVSNSLGGDKDGDDVLSISAEAHEKLEALNANDIELYAFMQQLAAGQRARLQRRGGRAHSAQGKAMSSKGAEALADGATDSSLIWKRRFFGDAVKLRRREH